MRITLPNTKNMKFIIHQLVGDTYLSSISRLARLIVSGLIARIISFNLVYIPMPPTTHFAFALFPQHEAFNYSFILLFFAWGLLYFSVPFAVFKLKRN